MIVIRILIILMLGAYEV